MPANHGSCLLHRRRQICELWHPSSGLDRLPRHLCHLVSIQMQRPPQITQAWQGTQPMLLRGRVLIGSSIARNGARSGQRRRTTRAMLQSRNESGSRPNQLHVSPRRTSRRFSSVVSRSLGYDTSDRLCRRPPSLLNAVNPSWLLSSPRLTGEGWPLIARAGMRFCLLKTGTACSNRPPGSASKVTP